MAAFSFASILDKVKQQRERIVILVLLALVLGISWNIYSLLQLQKTDQKAITDQILFDHGYQDPIVRKGLPRQVDPASVAAAVIDVPSPEDIVRPLIEVDPLRPREDIHQIRQRIGMLLEEVRQLQKEGKWADAIVICDAILEIDPAEVKYDYRGERPSELRKLCIRQQTRERMLQARGEAERNDRQGRELLEAGDKLKARNVLLQARRDYVQVLDMDPDRVIFDAGFYEGIDSRVEELTEVTKELIEITLYEDVAGKREQAEKELAAYRAAPSDLPRLAAAREALVESLNIVQLVDPAGTIVAATEVEDIESRLQEVDEIISGVLPGLVEKIGEQIVALNSAESVEEGILRAEKVLESLGILLRIRRQPDYEQTYKQVQAIHQDLNRRLDLQHAQEIYAEAEDHYRKALEAHQRGDRTTAANERETALAVLARMRSLPEENVVAWLAEAAELERKIKLQIASLPMIQGVELTAVDPGGKWVTLRSRVEGWQATRHDLNITHPRTRIRLEEVVPNPEGEPPYAVISRPERAKTKVSMGAG